MPSRAEDRAENAAKAKRSETKADDSATKMRLPGISDIGRGAC
jgi:hypothetical protein